MLSPTVIVVGLHDLGSSPLRSSWSPTRRSRVGLQLDRNGLEWSCTRWSTTDSDQVHRGQVEVQRGEAELDFNLAEMDLSWSCTRWTSVDSTQGHRVQVQVQRGAAELNLDLDEVALSWSCNFSAMLTSREASTPRRSRGVLVLPTSQHCSRVNAGSPSATSVQCWRVGRQVHRGVAEVYLSSLRVNIAEESVVDHRVQLQCKVDELEGKYTEAQPRCTCPSYELTLHPSRWSPTPITVGLNFSTLTAPPLLPWTWPVTLSKLRKMNSLLGWNWRRILERKSFETASAETNILDLSGKILNNVKCFLPPVTIMGRTILLRKNWIQKWKIQILNQSWKLWKRQEKTRALRILNVFCYFDHLDNFECSILWAHPL